MNPGVYYHIYNHANGSETLYREPDNYRHFLQQWQNTFPRLLKRWHIV